MSNVQKVAKRASSPGRPESGLTVCTGAGYDQAGCNVNLTIETGDIQFFDDQYFFICHRCGAKTAVSGGCLG